MLLSVSGPNSRFGQGLPQLRSRRKGLPCFFCIISAFSLFLAIASTESSSSLSLSSACASCIVSVENGFLSTTGDCSQCGALNAKEQNITLLDDDAFADWDVLESLDLSENLIETVGTAFHGMNQLNELNLASNKIMEFEFETFTGVSNMIKLDVRWNNIETLKSKMFQGLKGLQVDPRSLHARMLACLNTSLYFL
eukprot:94413-Rhodomonas_salina.2